VIDEPLMNAVMNGTAEVTPFIPSIHEYGPRVESHQLVVAAELDP
jgi:hypothetical protein